VVADIVVVGRSRTELTLSVEAPAAARGGLVAAETRLAKALLARVRA
jgi:adenine deaminase